MIDSPQYRRAGELYTQGHLSEAADLLSRLVAADHDDLNARHALAVCHTDLGNPTAAREQLEEIVRREPGRRDDTYRLAVILEDTGERTAAATLYRRLLADGPYRDAERRLVGCAPVAARVDDAGPGRIPATTALLRPPVGTMVTGHHPWEPDPVQETVLAGPDSIRMVVEAAGTTSRGQVVRTLRQQPRHRLPAILRGLRNAGLLLALAAVLYVAGRRLPADWLTTAGRPDALPAVVLHPCHRHGQTAPRHRLRGADHDLRRRTSRSAWRGPGEGRLQGREGCSAENMDQAHHGRHDDHQDDDEVPDQVGCAGTGLRHGCADREENGAEPEAEEVDGGDRDARGQRRAEEVGRGRDGVEVSGAAQNDREPAGETQCCHGQSEHGEDTPRTAAGEQRTETGHIEVLFVLVAVLAGERHVAAGHVVPTVAPG